MTGWLNYPLHPEPITDKCGSVYVAPFVPFVRICEPGTLLLAPFPAPFRLHSSPVVHRCAFWYIGKWPLNMKRYLEITDR